MQCILVLINIIKHRQISLTCLLPTHPRPSQPRYDTDDTDLRDSVWKEAHVTSEYLTIFDTFECWDFLLMASIEQILNEYKYFGNVSRGWRLATSCVLYWRHLHRVWQYDNMTHDNMTSTPGNMCGHWSAAKFPSPSIALNISVLRMSESAQRTKNVICQGLSVFLCKWILIYKYYTFWSAVE